MGIPKGWKLKPFHPKIMKKVEQEVKRRKAKGEKVDQTEILNAIVANHYKIK